MHPRVDFECIQHGSGRLDDQIVGDGQWIVYGDLGAPRDFVFDVDGVGEGDGLKNRPQLVKAVRVLIEDAQIQVDLRQRLDRGTGLQPVRLNAMEAL